MACNTSPCQILRLGSKNQLQEAVKGRSGMPPVLRKRVLGLHRAEPKTEAKLFPGKVTKGAEERRWWGKVVVRKEENYELRTSEPRNELTMSTGYCSYDPRRLWHRCLKGVSAPTKGCRKGTAVLHCPQTTRWSRMVATAYTAHERVTRMFPWWPCPHHHSEAQRQKARSTKSASEVGHSQLHLCKLAGSPQNWTQPE